MKLKNNGEFPDNLLEDVVAYGRQVGREIRIGTKPQDFDRSLLYVLQTFLTERERMMIAMRYQNHLSFNDIGAEQGITRERARQIINKAIRKLSRKSTFDLLAEGVRKTIRNCTQTDEEKAVTREQEQTHIADLQLSCRAYNCLRRYGAATLADILRMDLEKFARMRNVGTKTLAEIVEIREKNRTVSEGWCDDDR